MHRRSWHRRIVSEISNEMRALGLHPAANRLSYFSGSTPIRRLRLLPFVASLAVAVAVLAAMAPQAQTATQVTSANSTGYTSPSAASNLLNAAGVTLTPSVTPPFVANGDAATSRTYATLTDGSFGSLRTSTADTTDVEMQTGSSLLYTFAAPETISTIDTYSGWANADRVNQTYSILYTTTTNNTLTMLTGSSVNFAPAPIPASSNWPLRAA